MAHRATGHIGNLHAIAETPGTCRASINFVAFEAEPIEAAALVDYPSDTSALTLAAVLMAGFKALLISEHGLSFSAGDTIYLLGLGVSIDTHVI